MNRFCSRNGKREGLVGKHLPLRSKNARQINVAGMAELVDARDLKFFPVPELSLKFWKTAAASAAKNNRTKRVLENGDEDRKGA